MYMCSISFWGVDKGDCEYRQFSTIANLRLGKLSRLGVVVEGNM